MNAVTKSRMLSPERRCVPTCKTWIVVNDDTEPEIQRCDTCWQNTPGPTALTDTEATSLEDARAELHAARTRLARRRELARASRRTAIIQDDGLISPCCRQLVHLRGFTFPAVCSRCGRLLQLPPGIEP